MTATIKVPPLLRKWVKDQSEIQAQGSTIGECIQNMILEYPGLEIRLKTMVVCLNGNVVQPVYYGRKEIREGDEISLIPMMSGG
jgi:molybdopterin converting factor small subunit